MKNYRARGITKDGKPSVRITEKAFQQTVMEALKLAGYSCYHTWLSMHSTRGFPDIIATNPTKRHVMAIELKSESGKMTDEQSKWLTDLSLCGIESVVLRPSEFDEFWERIKP